MAETTVDDNTREHVDDELVMREQPPTPPSPEDLEAADAKGSRKREREVSLEPATPKADDPALSTADEFKERRTPATKKNRVKLGTTLEEDETPPPSPTKPDIELSTSPPHETKVRQISMRVRGLKWDESGPEQHTQTSSFSDIVTGDEEGRPDIELQPAADIADDMHLENTQNVREEEPVPETTALDPDAPVASIDEDSEMASSRLHSSVLDSEADDSDKQLKRKLGDRVLSSNAVERHTEAGVEPAKRARDDEEQDDNPRDKKRPSPPPEKDKAADDVVASQPEATAPEPAALPVTAPAPAVGGFLAYASTSSPFSQAKGPSIFTTKPSPTPSPAPSTSKSPFSDATPSVFGSNSSTSPFAIASSSRTPLASFGSSNEGSSSSKDTTTPAGTKRSGFEAFASSASPFASAARSKSPTGSLRANSATGLARSKSPPRRNASTVNAFKSYAATGSQSFVAPSPPIKKQRQDQGSESDSAEGEKTEKVEKVENAEVASTSTSVLNGTASKESDDESDRPTSFGERLRAGRNDDESVTAGSDDDESKLSVTEQEVQTGEEEDDTVFQVRGKLYALSPQNTWKERGTGQLKLNVRKTDGGGARLVMRKEAVYALLLNVTLFKGMRCTLAQDPRYVRFSCIEQGSIVHYNLRLANAKVANELLEEISANIPGDEPEEV